MRTGGTNQTKLNYTGQRRDDTGLLYYHARYYDPSLARFVSPDSIVPGVSSGKGGARGTVGAWQNSSLTVDFHETAFSNSVSEENSIRLESGFWSDELDPDGPINPQALNRYAYALNNPVRYVDPTGHSVPVPPPPNAADALLANGTRVSGTFPHYGQPANSAYYRTDANGNVTSYAVYNDKGVIVKEVNVVGSPHNGQPTPHVHEYKQVGTDPNGDLTMKREYRGPANPDEVPTRVPPGAANPSMKTGRGRGGGGSSGRGGGGGSGGRGGRSSPMSYLGAYGALAMMNEMYVGSVYGSSGQYDGPGGGHGGHYYR